MKESILDHKKILAVDDEPDILMGKEDPDELEGMGKAERLVIPAIEPESRDSDNWGFWMPDQVRYDRTR